MAQTQGSTTTRYAQDLAAPLSQILSDGTQRYVYGNPAERLLQEWTTYRTWYSVDALGSVRATLSDAGIPQAAASYDAWGVPETAMVAPFGFTGELQSGSDVWLRARWYGAGRGAFGGRDAFEGFAHDPVTLQPYVYAANNPVLWTDASGQTWYLSFDTAKQLWDDLDGIGNDQSLVEATALAGTEAIGGVFVAWFAKQQWGTNTILKAITTPFKALGPAVGVIGVGLGFRQACESNYSMRINILKQMVGKPLSIQGIGLAYVPSEDKLYSLDRHNGSLYRLDLNGLNWWALKRELPLDSLRVGQVWTDGGALNSGYAFTADNVDLSIAYSRVDKTQLLAFKQTSHAMVTQLYITQIKPQSQ